MKLNLIVMEVWKNGISSTKWWFVLCIIFLFADIQVHTPTHLILFERKWNLNFQSFMQVSQSLSCSECYQQSRFPSERWKCLIEEMIFQASVWHIFIYKQSLNSSCSIQSTVSYEFDQIWMLHNSKKLNFCQPLLVSLFAEKRRYVENSLPSEICIAYKGNNFLSILHAYHSFPCV